MNISNFKELYNLLQTTTLLDRTEFNKWIKTDNNQQSGYRQEAMLRILGVHNTIVKLNSYTPTKGNFNSNEIEKQKTYQEFYYNKTKLVNICGNGGDSSDFTMLDKTDNKHILIISSKSLTKEQSGKFDFEKMTFYANKYTTNGYTVSYGLCVPNKLDTDKIMNNTKTTSKELKELYYKKDTIIIDHDDLYTAVCKFNKAYSVEDKNNQFEKIITCSNKPFILKMHQYVAVEKTMKFKKNKKKNVLWGHIQRSGKSYIIGGCVYKDGLTKKKCNYLIITTAPKETIEQYLTVFNHSQFNNFNKVYLYGDNKDPVLKDRNIIVCSKQFLQTKIEDDDIKSTEEETKTIEWLKKMKFNIRFLDESHNGGSTELAQKTLKYYGNASFTVQITATYTKPVNHYNIPRTEWILWDVEDIKFCKNINKDNNKEELINKHGDIMKHIIQEYSNNNIITEYSKFPELCILTGELTDDTINDIINETQNTSYGWSVKSSFLLQDGFIKNNTTPSSTGLKRGCLSKFKDDNTALDIWYRIFGKNKQINNSLSDNKLIKKSPITIPDPDYPIQKTFINRIKDITMNSETSSRFIGDDGPSIIMAFLPQENIYELSAATKNLLEKYNVIPDYDIVCINSKTTTDPKMVIEKARVKAMNSNKKAVLVLSGRQCSLGVSIDNCDIVILLNNNTGFDMIYQMMFRGMTEGKNKKFGFVIDPDIKRVIKTSIINYATTIKPNKHPKEAVQYMLNQRLITINCDHWMPCFGKGNSALPKLSENIYDIYSTQLNGALDGLFQRMKLKIELFNTDEFNLFHSIFNKINITSEQANNLNEMFNELNKVNEIKEGIEKNADEYSDDDMNKDIYSDNDKSEDDILLGEEKKINPMDILKPISVIISLLTIHNKQRTTLEEMYNLVETDVYKKDILIKQVQVWWGDNINNDHIELIINIFKKYLMKDEQTTQLIRTIKELFVKNINNSNELSKIIDKYLIPQSNEKKKNAEVSTPYKLRQEMLDKMPTNFWITPKKVLEPCCGKGGFVVDIISRFMDGLKTSIPDNKERYKVIVEECIYWCDINPTNIYISKLLIDPYNEYKLNIFEGDTLKLYIKKEWGIDGFDGVIGNPPYQDSEGSSNGTLWDKFVEYAITNINKYGILCYIHPAGWRNVSGKFKKTQELIFNNNLIYLEIHNESDGIKTFKAETRYDWYILKKDDKYKTTKIKFEDDKIMNINIRELDFIPNGQFNIVKDLLALDNEDKCDVLYNRSSYGCDKKWVSKIKKEGFDYPCVYTINSNSELKLLYSNKSDGNGMNKYKLMWSNGRIKSIGSVIDKEGKYGLTQFAYAIVDKIEHLENIKTAFDSYKFRRLMEYCAVGQLTVNYKIISLFKKDFWKQFI